MKCTYILPAMLCLALLKPAVGQAQGSGDLNARLKSVHTLIEKSSAARQIQSSGDRRAKQKHEQARQYYKQAEANLRAGQRRAGDEALLQATKTMLEAVRLADQEQVVEGKKRRDFDNRLQSVNALLDAHERISNEKGSRKDIRELRSIVDGKINKARSLMSQGKFDSARKMLDETYVATKTAIEKLRGGDTLVRSLNFASKKEEYDYEIDRNNTHKMLVSVLLAEKMQDARTGKQVKQLMDKATRLRSKAEQQAKRGNYKSAVQTLEASTKEIVRAIRSAGIYIPG